jgi:phosphoribosylformylglycinamidine cyclo-ligase
MPGFYADGEYDLAGFIVGTVERHRLIDGRGIVPGDVLLGLPSAGLHTNGYSLARKIVFDVLGLGPDSYVSALGATIGEALLAPHRTYLPVVKSLLGTGRVKGMAHITGGGITDNLPRILPAGTAARVRRSAWPRPPLFSWLVEAGRVPVVDAYRTFNMGIGLILVVGAGQVAEALATLRAAGEAAACEIGDVVAGDGAVTYAG